MNVRFFLSHSIKITLKLHFWREHAIFLHLCSTLNRTSLVIVTKSVNYWWFIDSLHGIKLHPDDVIIRRPHYQPDSLSSRADDGRGLILRAITKTPIR